MPTQTTNTDFITFPDGAKVSIQPNKTGSFYDIGALNSSVTCTLNYTENQITTANAGKTVKQIRDMNIEGSMTLINLDPDNIERMGGGIFTKTTTLASATTSIPDQVIAAGWDDANVYPLEMYTSSSDSTKLRMSTAPTITSVTLDAAGTPETLTAGNDYVIVESDCVSGYGITFVSANMSTGTPKTKAITIDYGSNTPVARTTLNAGSSTAVLDAYAMKIEHTDSNSLVIGMTLYSVDAKSGGFQFAWKGANEDGLSEMPLSFQANLDSTLTDGAQLLSYYRDNGAA